mmetsp:Transcript_9014/g.25747  ORF Transcript_9014/g.25747 Transcript_9014/m.25747 type:complete len:308 (-) Transcript_9014:305-1228(-)
MVTPGQDGAHGRQVDLGEPARSLPCALLLPPQISTFVEAEVVTQRVPGKESNVAPDCMGLWPWRGRCTDGHAGLVHCEGGQDPRDPDLQVIHIPHAEVIAEVRLHGGQQEMRGEAREDLWRQSKRALSASRRRVHCHVDALFCSCGHCFLRRRFYCRSCLSFLPLRCVPGAILVAQNSGGPSQHLTLHLFTEPTADNHSDREEHRRTALEGAALRRGLVGSGGRGEEPISQGRALRHGLHLRHLSRGCRGHRVLHGRIGGLPIIAPASVPPEGRLHAQHILIAQDLAPTQHFTELVHDGLPSADLHG